MEIQIQVPFTRSAGIISVISSLEEVPVKIVAKMTSDRNIDVIRGFSVYLPPFNSYAERVLFWRIHGDSSISALYKGYWNDKRGRFLRGGVCEDNTKKG